jgi:hypothetical protein
MICRRYECPEGYEAGTSIAAERFPFGGAVAVCSNGGLSCFAQQLEVEISIEMRIMHRRGAIQ